MKSLIDKISLDLGLNREYVASIVRRSSCYYKDYKIPKRNGNERKISQASPELKSLQYWVKNNVLSLLPVSKAAFAYNTGDSIAKHAEYHKESYFIFHTDIKNFFPSITAEHLVKILEANQEMIEAADLWYDDICEVVSAICFRFGRLCIGTVSSPCICNIVMYKFDEYFLANCKGHKWKYSRYADDIFISSQVYLPENLRKEVDDKLSENGFLSNDEKTCFMSKKGRRQITGLVLTETGRVSIGTARRRAIKDMIYNRIVNGQGNPDIILGHLAFLKDVEPAVYNNYMIKYAAYCDGDVIAAIRSGPPKKLFRFELPEIDL